jgi:tetratricopeptide (TPR) repeat protein
MSVWLRCGVLAGWMAAWIAAGAQGGMGAMPGMQVVPAPDQLPVPVKMTGIGNGHIAITATPEAQAWFDQGLNLMHDFWDYESAKAFEQGVRVDPKCAMCYWGLAKVEGFRGGPEKVYGTKALAEAVKLKKHTSGAEKLYIEAAQALSDGDGKNDAEIVVLRKLVKKYPHDLQGRIFLATAVEDGYDEKGEPKAGEKEGIAILEGVLKDAPNDSAANHYWIHAIEPSNHPERAIPSAALLASLAPTSGHMAHMPGHIYYRVGDYADAEHWFTASMVADEAYMHGQHVDVDDDWNYVHNMMYAIANLMEQGKLAEANALSDRLAGARGKLSATLYIWSARDSMARVSRQLPVALRVGDWDAVLAMLDAQPVPVKDGLKNENLRFLSTELHAFALGMRALDAGNPGVAETASDAMDAGLWRVSQKDTSPALKRMSVPVADASKPPMVPLSPDALEAPLVQTLTVASLELRAGVLAAQGKVADAKKIYETAEAKEKDLGYHEPPFYIRPVGETEAAAMLRAKDYPAATKAYEAALQERPDSGFALYGLARTRELSGDTAGARAGYQAFLKAWASADPGLPELVHAREVAGGVASAAVR